MGGVRKFSDVLDLSGKVRSHDFQGCLHSVTVNGRSLAPLGNSPLETVPIHVKGVSKGCGRSQATSGCGLSQQCANQGRCVDGWTEVECRCTAEFTGDKCEISKYTISTQYLHYIYIIS